MTALLIDDDVNLLETIRSNVEELGLELHTASSWDEGLALFHVVSPTLVLADYNLPGSSHGLRLLLEIRSLRPSVRLVLVSGVVNPDELSKVEALGLVDRVLSKGTGMESTRQILAEVSGASATRDEPTDWTSFAQALVDHRSFDEKAIEELDDRLRSQAERNQ